jgi:uncharacterized membrane protein (DUF106 family)
MSFIIVMLLAMVIYSVPFLRDGIGAGADVILGPFSSLFVLPGSEPAQVSWIIVILVLSVITGSYSSLLQKYTIDYEKMQRIQNKMKEFQKLYREVQLSGDEKKLKKLNDKRDKMMQEQMQMSQEQFKPMAWIMVITVPIFLWLLFVVNVSRGIMESTVMYDIGTITFPYWGTIPMIEPTSLFLPAWILWYMVCSLTFSQVIRKALNIGGL